MEKDYDVVIVGAGPCGLTAGLYTSRNKLATLIIEREIIGGKLSDRELIENYPSYPDGILGSELASRMIDQASKYGARIQLDEVEAITTDGKYKVVRTSAGDCCARTIIIAGGARNKKLGIPGEEEFTDKGVFYCAMCDGPSYANKVVAVAGGGDSGLTEALSLASYAKKVIVIEVMGQCTATKILVERFFFQPNVELRCGNRIEAVMGDEHVRGLRLTDMGTGNESVLDVDGLLVQIGLEPNTGYLIDMLRLDKARHIVVDANMQTHMPGVFAAGDIRGNSAMQIATAVGDGATAGIAAHRFLMENE